MKTVILEESTLDRCVQEAQLDRVLITRQGKPVAVVIGAGDYDEEDLELMASADFWRLMQERRQQPSISRVELERRLAERDSRAATE